MRKNYVLYSALALGMMGSFASCSSDDDFTMSGVDNGGIVADADQVIEIAVENADGGLQTRAGRDLESDEPAQDIDFVKVIITNEVGETIVADTLFTKWMTASDVQDYDDASGHGRRARFVLSGSNALAANTKYKVYAIGYSDNSQYYVNNTRLDAYMRTVGNGKQWSSELSEGAGVDENYTAESVKSFGADFAITNGQTPANTNTAEEIFAGSTEISVDADGHVSAGVTLHRQVAGIYSYVRDIPYMFEGSEVGTNLRLYAIAKNQDLVLGNYYTKTLGNNGNNVSMNVVNGMTPATGAEAFEVYNINLEEWFDKLVDVNNDGILDTYQYTVDSEGTLKETSTLVWKGDDDKYRPGSAFEGKFIVPFAAVSGKEYTFQLRLTNAANTKTFRTWNIKLPKEDVLNGVGSDITGASLITVSKTPESKFEWTPNASVIENQNNYSVMRNHLYSVGIKEDANDPGKPTDPETLNTKQDLMLKVNANWEVIHRMEVE